MTHRIIATLFGLLLSVHAHGGVVVGTEVGQLSREEIKQLYLGETDTLDGVRVQLADLAPAQAEFLRKVLGTSARSYKRLWVKKLFADGMEAPLRFDSEEELIRFLKQHPNAIGYLPAPPDDPKLQVLLEF